MSVATDQTIQIANIRRRSRPWNGRESAGKALREVNKNIHPTKWTNTAGIRRTKKFVPPPRSQTIGPGTSSALPNAKAKVP